MPYATATDGVRLYYEEVGAGEPLLLISGQGSDHTGWDAVRADFADRYRVIVYDHRGTGQSDKPAEPPYTIHGFARDAVAVLDHLHIPRAHAYGISMGGRICQWLGIEHAARVGSLVLGCTTPGNAHGVRRPAEVDEKMANRPADPQAATAALLDTLVSPAWSAAHPEFAERIAQRRATVPAYAQKLHYRASEGHDSWDLLPTIEVPTLVIHGDEDPVNVTANAYLLAERIPGAELSIIKSGRHLYFVEFRSEASRIVRDFLRRHPL